MKNLLVALDLEFNQPSGKIIQIGAVLGNSLTGEIVDEFSCMVNPLETLSPAIIELTGISQDQVDSGVSLTTGYNLLQQWLTPSKKHRVMNPLTWGGGDSIALLKELNDPTLEETFIFGRRWLDTKTLYTAWAIQNRKDFIGGLEKSTRRVGLNFEGRPHNALTDARNTFHMWMRLSQKFNKES